jgi:hypothetical protein
VVGVRVSQVAGGGVVRKIQGTFEVILLGVGGLSCLVMYLATSMK